jgi:hypothetical protein
MRLRHHDTEQPNVPPCESEDGAADTAALGARGEELLAAADAAIARALSRNSAEFLAQNRQSGGQ